MECRGERDGAEVVLLSAFCTLGGELNGSLMLREVGNTLYGMQKMSSDSAVNSILSSCTLMGEL
jgi:hypothetical protein